MEKHKQRFPINGRLAFLSIFPLKTTKNIRHTYFKIKRYPKNVKSKGNTIILTKKKEKQQNILEKLKSAFECLTEKLKPRQELWGQVTS